MAAPHCPLLVVQGRVYSTFKSSGIYLWILVCGRNVSSRQKRYSDPQMQNPNTKSSIFIFKSQKYIYKYTFIYTNSLFICMSHFYIFIFVFVYILKSQKYIYKYTFIYTNSLFICMSYFYICICIFINVCIFINIILIYIN